jgi:4-amino-4-deoxy-L-arabinose transferase-like glycosyltransferase
LTATRGWGFRTHSPGVPLRALRTFILSLLDHRRAFGVIVGVGLAIRVVALALLARTPLTGDAESYHETALGLLGAAPFEPHWPPGMPLLLLPGYAVFGASPLVARSVMLLVYLAFCASVRALGRRIGGDRVANLALAIFAVTPIFVWISVNPLTQLPTAALTLGAVYFADRCRWSASRKDGGSLVMDAGFLGLCLGALLLTRPPNVLVVGALPLYVAWRAKAGRGKTLVIPLAVVAVVTSAWCFKAYTATGRFVFINDANSQNIWYGNNPWTPTYHTWYPGSHKPMPPEYEERLRYINHRPDRDHFFVQEAVDHILARPDLFLVRTASRVRTFIAYDTFTSAQLQTQSRLGAAVVLLLDAAFFVLVGYLALLFPAVVSRPGGWRALMEATGGTGDEAAWKEERTELVRLLLLVGLLFAFPYFVVFSNPTFHPPFTALISMIGAPAGVAVLATGLRPLWAGLPRRGKLATAAAFAAFFAIQLEWTVDLFGRSGG